MLVLSRKPGEKILIGDLITIVIVRIGPNTVRIGIEAPRDMSVVREELADDASETVRHQLIEWDSSLVAEAVCSLEEQA